MHWAPKRAHRRMAFLILALLGCALRGVGIQGSLGLDEFGTLWAVEASWPQAWSRALAFHGQSPLYYLLVWLPVHAVGESESSLRILSILFAACAAGLVARLGARFGRAEIGWLAAVLLWLDPNVVMLSAQARPYTLAISFSALMLYGFLRATQSEGDRRGRVFFVLGGVGLFYSHYYLALQAAGLALAYALRPELRRRYAPRAFALDVGVQLILVLPCAPQLLDLWSRRSVLVGFAFDPLTNLRTPIEVAGLLLFLALIAYVRPFTAPREKRPEAAVLWSAALVPVGLGLLLVPLGVNLLIPRYLAVMVVPVAVLAARSVVAQSPRSAGALLILWAFVVAGTFAHSFWLRGTFSQAGTEDMRHAVSVLEAELSGDARVPVLYRSGFAEDDLNALGAAPPALRAPLRSPGRRTPDWNLVPLTFQWSAAGREDYFREVVGPALGTRRVFYLYSHASGGYVGEYLEALQPWLEDHYGAEVEVEMIYGGWGMLILRYQVRPRARAH